MGDWLYLVLAIAAAAVALVGTLLVRGGRRTPPSVPPAPSTAPAPPVETSAETAAEVEVPEAPAAPELERPEGTASRLVRLRQRLAGSQSGLGRGLLALLSRDRLDEDTWESIEDTLLTADVGVAPTQELVEKLRTRMRVDGGQGVDVRAVLREELL